MGRGPGLGGAGEGGVGLALKICGNHQERLSSRSRGLQLRVFCTHVAENSVSQVMSSLWVRFLFQVSATVPQGRDTLARKLNGIDKRSAVKNAMYRVTKKQP